MSSAALVAAVRRGLRTVLAAASRALVPVRASARPTSETTFGTQNTAPSSTPTNDSAAGERPDARAAAWGPPRPVLDSTVGEQHDADAAEREQERQREPDAAAAGADRRGVGRAQRRDRRRPGSPRGPAPGRRAP